MLMFDAETYATALAYFKAHGGGGGTNDYDDLNDKPQVNSVTLSGNQTSTDLGITQATIIGHALVIN